MRNPDKPDFLPPLSIPQADLSVRERALYRALIAFRQAPLEAARPPARARYRFAFGGVLVLLVAFLWAYFGQRSGEADSSASLAKTLKEVEILFPRQLNAIVERQGDIQLDLAPLPDNPVEQPIYVELHRGRDSVRIISYSGRRITVTLGGRQLTFEPLVTGSGEVILLGSDFIWPGAAASFHAKVHPLFKS